MSTEISHINTNNPGTEPFAADPQLLTPREVARWLRVQEQTLAIWRSQGVGPKYYKVPAVRYKRCDVLEWLEQRLVVPAGGVPSSLASS